MFKYFTPIFVLAVILMFAHSAFAAQIYTLPAGGSFGIGKEANIDIKINSEEESINAAQATLRWPANVLEFAGANKEGSSFNFWVEEPVASSDGSSLNFIGGTAKGISGSSLQILRLKFKTKSAGTAELSISDAAITASDGKGTNVLSKIIGANFRVGAEVVQSEVPEPAPGKLQIAPVARKAISSSKLPQKPEITVPLYPDSEKWHSYSGDAVALWKVPDDVSAMAVAFDQSPNTVPYTSEKELSTGKKLSILGDGIWFVHTRFRNNIGWGPTAHYRLAIDTKPPLGFEVTMAEGEVTDNPTPTLQFKTNDALSGLKEYQVRIGDGDLIKIPVAEFNGNLTLPLQPPGKRQIVVRAVDYAGNSIEDSIELETIPIVSPTITFVPTELFSDEEKGLAVKGASVPAINVLLRLYRQESLVAEKTIQADERGNWEFTFDQAFKNGSYKITAQSQDARGALSLVAESAPIKIKSKPIIQLGPLQLGMGGAALLLLFILIASFGGGIWFYKKRQEKLAMRVSFTESEITKIFKLIAEDVESLSKAYHTPTSGDDEYELKRLRDNIQKMETYLKKGVEKIKK